MSPRHDKTELGKPGGLGLTLAVIFLAFMIVGEILTGTVRLALYVFKRFAVLLVGFGIWLLVIGLAVKIFRSL